MKKILIILFLLYSISNASDNYELKLYEKVLPSIFKQLPIKIYTDDDIKDILKHSNKFDILSTCTDAVVVIIGKNFENISQECKNKPIFATSYRGFKNYQNSFGAFYWRKGRPQIRFKNDTLNRYNLNLPNSLKKYAK